MPGFRALLSHFRGSARVGGASGEQDDPSFAALKDPVPSALDDLMSEIEAAALEVYEVHGLPLRRGHYVRSPRSSRWTFVAEFLSAEERWALVLSKPSGRGWRFATRDELGNGHPLASVQSAAQVLGACRALRSKITGGCNIEAAIRLGYEWRALQHSAVLRNNVKLKLLPPSEVKARRSQRRARISP